MIIPLILRACEYVKRVDDVKENDELPDNNFKRKLVPICYLNNHFTVKYV